MPTGIGVGSTWTLAKLADHVAKTAERKRGSYPADLAQVCILAALPASDLDAVLAATAVGDIWGVGRLIGRQAGGRRHPDRARHGPHGSGRDPKRPKRTVRELQGISCVDLEDLPPAKKEIACTRSFGRPVSDLPELIKPVSTHASRAAEKLRIQDGHACKVLVFAHTSPHRPGPSFSRSMVVPLRRPTSHTPLLVEAAMRGITRIYEPGDQLIKCGVMLLELQPASRVQHELDLDEPAEEKARLMAALDTLNDRYGRGTLKMASTGAGPKKAWGMKHERKTPEYTTRWDDIPTAKA